MRILTLNESSCLSAAKPACISVAQVEPRPAGPRRVVIIGDDEAIFGVRMAHVDEVENPYIVGDVTQRPTAPSVSDVPGWRIEDAFATDSRVASRLLGPPSGLTGEGLQRPVGIMSRSRSER